MKKLLTFGLALAAFGISTPAFAENVLIPSFPPFSARDANAPRSAFCSKLEKEAEQYRHRLANPNMPHSQHGHAGATTPAEYQARLAEINASQFANVCDD
jgi:hypothetical protein